MANDNFTTSLSGYTIKLAESHEFAEVVRFTGENFDREETIYKCLREDAVISGDEEKLLAEDESGLLWTLLNHSPCLVIIHDASRAIVGVNVMFISVNPKIKPNAEIDVLFNANSRAALSKQYFTYMNELSEKSNIFKMYPNTKHALEFYALCVESNHRRKGLAKALVKAGLVLAKQYEDIGYTFAICTSQYSKKSAEACGMKCAVEIDLLIYKDKNGEEVFRNSPPHNIVSTMIYKM